MRARFFGLLCFALTACGESEQSKLAVRKIPEEFSGANALKHVQALVDLGPRPPESEAIEKARAYLTAQLEGFGWRVMRQNFSEETPRGKKNFTNLIATLPGKAMARKPTLASRKRMGSTAAAISRRA